MVVPTGAIPGGVFSPIAGFPSFPLDQLSDDEVSLVNYHVRRIVEQRPSFDLSWSYYDGVQRMQDLGISIPPQLASLKTVIGWPQIGIDALVHRLNVEGFRYPTAVDVDDRIMQIWQSNNLDGESPMAHLEALVSGRAYIVVGSPDADSVTGQPLITVESPRNMSVLYDARLRRVTSALQFYYDANYASDQYGYNLAAFYTPVKTIFMGRVPVQSASDAQWQVTSVDTHDLGFVPIVRMGNRQRLSDRSGRSEITPSWMNTVDSAARTLLGMEVARELFATPRRYMLGATEEMFQNPDGTPISKWQAYLDQLWMVERDENGNVPTVGQFNAADPSTYTKLIDVYTSVMAMNMGVPIAMLGSQTQGNPASADAIRVSYQELTERARAKQTAFSEAWEQAMRYALRIADGSYDPQASRIETDWRDPAPRTLAGDSDAITKQITSGAIPATSDVTLKHLGYTAVERARLQIDRDNDQGESLLLELAHNIDAKALTIDKRLEGVDGSTAGGPAGAGAPSPAGVGSGSGPVAPARPA